MCSLKAATRNLRALQPWEGQRRDPCPSAAGARRSRGLPGEQRCPLSPLPLLPPQGSWKGAERNSSHLQEIRLLEKHFLSVTQEQISRAGLQSGEGRQLESRGGQHIPNGIFLLLEAGMGPGSRDPTLSHGPFQKEQRGPAATQSAPDASFPPLPLPYLVATGTSPSTSIPHRSL